jgi:hypothetical protein
MADEHEELRKAAEKAVEDLFGDTSVPSTETLTDLEALQEKIDGCMAAIRDDLKRA